MSNTPNELVKFREKYKPQKPLRPSTADESLLLDSLGGFRLLEHAPTKNVYFGNPPATRRSKGAHRYLWVISEAGVPFIKESPVLALKGQIPKHTNLTGGQPAYVGGELWFETTERLFVSGGSGRYPPNNADQLADAVGVFEAYRYQVTSLGWDYETDNAKRTLE